MEDIKHPNDPNTEPKHVGENRLDPEARSNTDRDLGRRLDALEKSVADLNKSHLDILKWSIATIFPVIALLLTALGFLTRYDAGQAIKESGAKVEKATSDMEKRFNILAGETLKKPVLELLHEGNALQSQIVNVFHDGPESFPYEVSLSTLFLKNTGDRRTEVLSVRVFFAAPLGLSYGRQEWEQAASSEKDYASSFYSIRNTTVAPGESLNLHSLIFNWTDPDRQTNVLCKIQVFYGGEKPAEAQFRVKVKQR